MAARGTFALLAGGGGEVFRSLFPGMLPLFFAMLVLLIAAAAEGVHLRRIRVVGRLAFGPEGRARAWTRMVPWLRVLGLAAIAWGLAVLLTLNRGGDDGAGGGKTGEPTRLIFVGD